MKKIELEVIALSHSITHSHSYAVVLGEANGMRRLPVVIGGFEAQSIAIALEKMSSTRPLTHDLIKNMAVAFDIEVKEVIINNLADGIFYSQIICQSGKETIEIDSRTSDALAIALRFDCPIYTYEFILDSAGIVFDGDEEEILREASKKTGKSSKKVPVKKVKEDLVDYSLSELEEQLKKVLAKEDYEGAIAIRDEIEKRKKNS